MNYIPFSRMQSRVESSKEDSDIAYFYDLLVYGEYLTKVIALYLVATINEDNERTQYRFEHRLARANAIGDFSKVIDEIIIGPASQLLTSDIREFEFKELSERAKINSWQHDSQLLITDCLEIFNITHNKISTKSSLRNWFMHFTHLRNKTRGHGSPTHDKYGKACVKLKESIELIVTNFTAFKRNWAHLHRNLSGKYRVSNITEGSKGFGKLTKEAHHSYENGVYVNIDIPRKINLFYTDTSLSDFWITNGNLSKNTFEAISYVTDDRMNVNADNYLTPTLQLPSSHTEGLSDLDILGECFTNMPHPPDIYINRLDIEKELNEILMQEDRFPIVTLLGRGGIGKTSLALNSIFRIAKETKRYSLIVWFSARDIDLLIDGPKQVQTKVLNISDIAESYRLLIDSNMSKKGAEQLLSDHLTKNDHGNTLFVFDNFETVTNPIELFEWINVYIRNPNKVLITSRISRNFKADYPIEIRGMNNDECNKLINTTAQTLEITNLLSKSYINEIIDESDGHPYVIKILLGEVARTGKANKVKRIVAEQEKILSALFKRTFNTLSPAAKRTLLTLCSWNSTVPVIALEAVLWRPENEKMNVQRAIEELRQSSFIDVITQDGDDIIDVPLAATIFGKGELEIYPEKIKVYADRELLMEFGATTYNNGSLSSGLANNIERKFKAVSNRITSIEEFQKELPLFVYIASKYPKTYEYIIDIFDEYRLYGEVKYYIREYLKNPLLDSEKVKLWFNLANVCKITNDWEGESHALIEMVQSQTISLTEVSNAANRINEHFYRNAVAKSDEYKSKMLSIIIESFKSRIKDGNATDYSRLGWLLLNNSNPVEAKKVAEEGLILDKDNSHCLKLLLRLEY